MKTFISMATAALLVVLLAIVVPVPDMKAVGSVKGYPLFFSGAKQITGDFVPNSPTAIVSTDAYAFHFSLSETLGVATTCTITDNQGTPKAYFKTVALAANQTYDDNPNGRYFQGGITWSCAASNAVIGEAWWKYL